MKYLLILILIMFSFRGVSQGGHLTKIAQVDIFVDSTYKFQVIRVPQFKCDDEVLELIFALYVLEHKQAYIEQKVRELYRSDLIATKPAKKKYPEILKL